MGRKAIADIQPCSRLAPPSSSSEQYLKKAAPYTLEDSTLSQSPTDPHSSQISSGRRSSLNEDCPILLELATHHDVLKESDLARCDSFVLHHLSVTIGELLGQGSFGEVRRGVCNGRPVAVKTLCPKLDVRSREGKELLKEIEMMSHGFQHRNVVEFYGIYEHGGLPWLVMELMPGGNLEQYYETKKQARRSRQWRPRTSRAVSWVEDILSALTFLHSQTPPVLHRDIKPGNMLLSADGRSIKIGDFGLSRRCPRSSSAEPTTTVTSEQQDQHPAGSEPGYNLTGTTGTFRYMAPEIYRGEAVYTAAVDVYSFGLLMWFIFAGGHPFSNMDGQTVAQLAATYGYFRPGELKERMMPRKLGDMMKRSWAMKAEERPRAEELLCELELWRMERGGGCGGWLMV